MRLISAFVISCTLVACGKPAEQPKDGWRITKEDVEKHMAETNKPGPILYDPNAREKK
jgi:hypothetical protein